MSSQHSRYRWFVVGVFFFFMLLHQTDKLMIGSLQVPISEDFGINNRQWGLINSGALIVATMLYPIWGYLYDHYARTRLLSLASFCEIKWLHGQKPCDLGGGIQKTCYDR